MNLYFRLFALAIKLLFSKKHNPLAPATCHFRVWPTDLDLNMHVNNGRYLTLMDLGRTDLMCKAGLFKTAFKKKWMPVLGKATIQYIRSLRCFQKFSITTQVVYWDEKWIYLEQKFYLQDKVVASAFVQALFLQKRNKITPQEVMASFDQQLTKPLPPAAILPWLDEEQTSTKRAA